MVGRTLGRFTITGPLGEGGIATVWKATDGLLGRTVAVKVLREEFAQDRKARLRFLREAQNHASLDDPGIVAVLDYGEHDGCVYLALALIEGRTVSERIRDSLLPIPEALRIACAVCEALAPAHARVPPLVHRDITSRNVMLGDDGRVWVLDFGLAVVAGRTRLTSTGHIIGTPAYVAPEYFRSEETPSPRSDVFSLGVLTYELMCGAVPFAMEHPKSMGSASLQTPRPLRALRPEVPPGLEAVVMRALASEAGERYADAAMFREALLPWRELLASPDGTTTGVPSPLDPNERRTQPVPQAPRFVAIAPFVPPAADADADGEGARLASRLAVTLEAALASAPELKVVPVPDDARHADDRGIADAAGANVIVRGTVHRAGSSLRVTFVVRDAARAFDLGGGVVDGSAMQPFDLEDRVVREVGALLGTGPVSVPAPIDPALADRLQRVRAWLRRNDVDAMVIGAVQELEHLRASRPDDPVVLATLTLAYLHRYRLTGERQWHAYAARTCERAIEIAEADADVLLATGELALVSGATERAHAAFDRARAGRPDTAEAELGLARVSMQEGALDRAAAHASEAQRHWPDDWRTHNLLGSIRYRQGDARAAAECWRRVVEIVPDSSRGWRNLGSALYRLGDFTAAICAYERALRIQPDARTYSNLATVLHYSARTAEALAAFQHAIDLSPADPVHWGNLGNACRWSLGHEAEAGPPLDRAIALMRDQLARNPRDADGWARMAGWLVNRGRAEDAKVAIAQALALAPEDVSCLMHAARVALVLGDTEAALARARDAVTRGYGVDELKNDPQFTELRSHPAFVALLKQKRGTERP